MKGAAATLAIVVGLAVAPAGCGVDVTRTEVVRASAPDGSLDAVVVQTDAGATAPFGELLYLTGPGCAATGTPAVRLVDARLNAVAAGVAVRWTAARAVTVSYQQVRFTDPGAPDPAAPWLVPVPSPAGEVAVRLAPGFVDPGRAPGAMPPTGGPPPRDCP